MTSHLNDAENLSRIREILLGNQLEAVEDQYQLLKEEVLKAVHQVDEKNKANLTDLETSWKEKEEGFIRRDGELQKAVTELQNDLGSLRQAMDESYSKLNKQLIGSFEKLQLVQEQQTKELEEQKSRLLALESSVMGLNQSKLDKSTIAQLLNKLANELLTEDHDVR